MTAGAFAGVDVHVARADELDQAGALTAEAYHADRLLDPEDEYETELRDAERRSREAVLLVATVAAHPRGSEPGERLGADGTTGGSAEPDDAGSTEVDSTTAGTGTDAAEVVVGTVTLAPYGTSYAEAAEPGEVELRMLAVAPEARHRGIAERLVVAALREAVAGGARRVVLSTLTEMVVAQRLYARLGFVPAPGRDWGHEGIVLHVLTWEPPAAPGVLVESGTWTPAATEVVDGWRLGLSDGFTRRANSALPLGTPADLAATLGRVEARYAAAGQLSVLRVCSAAPAGLRPLLAARGYTEVAATDVLVRDLTRPAEWEPGSASSPHGSTRGPDAGPRSVPGVRVVVAERPDDAWLDAWLEVKAGGHAVDREVARRVVTGSPALYLTAVSDRGADVDPIGVLRAAFAEDWVGLSCLVVTPEARRRGIGRLLTRSALRSAADRGARRAFLQVEAVNRGAADLYATEGFQPAERYAYWQR